ncbi:MAG: hypothetical protein LAO24_16635 [Acidobacteriia bacterium]|nr:hypothetical protein [Terriglobia bacterium]
MSLSGPTCFRPLSRIVAIIFVLAVLLLLPACWVYSVEPLYEERILNPDPDLTFDQTLVGSWAQVDVDCVWILSIEAVQQRYELTMAPAPDCKTEDKVTHYEAHLVKLDNHHFLDVSPKGDDVCDLCLPLHSFLLVSQEADRLALVPVDHEWLSRALTEKKVSLASLASQELGNAVVLTASTKELKDFARKYADDKAAFKTGSEFKLKFKRK